MRPSPPHLSEAHGALAYAETLVQPAPGAAGAPSIGPGAVLKHYEIIRKLGEGGMGSVFLARDTRLGRLVAIKFLLEYSGQAAERFLAEARVTARCRHDNIVVIYDVDDLDGYPYLVLEYIEGRTLQAFMEERGRPAVKSEAEAEILPLAPVPPRLAVELLLPVVRALESAHAMGIVHRDLKPGNIFLSNAGQVKVLDFGVAKQIDVESDLAFAPTAASMDPPASAELTQPGTMIGTMLYMAPEQWEGAVVDARTDIWAVGVILHELVTGIHPLSPFSLAELESVSALDVPMPSVRDRLPDAGPVAAVIERCLAKRRDDRFGSASELAAALEPLARLDAANALANDESPFAGLSAFQEADAARFFGRDSDVAAVVARLRKEPLIAIAGPSGAGKSSFVRAGVLPALKRSGSDVEAFVIRPGRRPLAALAEVLAGAGAAEGADPETTAATLRAQPGYLGAKLRARCRESGPDHHVVLFVDQLEELVTLGIEPSERAAFAACIEGVADDASSPLRVLLTVRADLLDRLSEDRSLLAKVSQSLVFLPKMTRAGLREALEKPLSAARHAFEDEALCDEMLDGLAGAKSPLPLLQFTAQKLWEARDREERLLTRQAYTSLGGVAGALSTHAGSVLAGLSAPEQRLARSILLRLVTPERTRAIVQLEELAALDRDGAAVEQVIDHLASARLVLIETSGEEHGKTVELTHESLIETWGKLRQWLDEDEHDAQFLAELRSAAKQWDQNGRAEGFLWRDRAAATAARWLERHRAERGAGARSRLGEREERYLEAVVRLSERTRRRRRQLVGGVIAFLGLFALSVSLLGLLARDQAARADSEARQAQKSAEEARESAGEAHKRTAEARNATRMATVRENLADPTLVLALLRELEPLGDLPPRWRELALWARAQGIASVVLHHRDIVSSAAYSPDGRRIATASWDKTARVWSADGVGEPLILRGHEDIVTSVAHSPDGRRVATASWDRTARVWSADGAGEPLVLRGHGDIVTSVAYSPDGRRVATASWDRTARVWSADGAGEPLILRGHRGSVESVAWSPDGRRIATASADKTARVWSADGAGEPLLLEGHRDNVNSVAWSPDGRRIATASADRTVRVWSADGAGEPLVLRGHQDSVASVVWSPDGRRLVTASRDRTARVWRADGTGKPILFDGHPDRVLWATWSPDGRRVLTASKDKTARVWNVEGAEKPLVLEGHQAGVTSVVWSPDGRRIATASRDRTARVWSADDAGEPLILEHPDRVASASFSHDGRRLVTAGYDRTARVWSADGTGEPLLLEGHSDRIASASFSPDGRRIVTAGYDRTARVWSADGAGEPLILAGHRDVLTSAAWSPDGRRIVTASFDRTARVWSADGAGEPLILAGHQELLTSAAWSPDGRRIVTGSLDRTARVWSAEGAGAPVILAGHTAAVVAGAQGGLGAWSPDGAWVVTLSDDKTLRLWSADGGSEPVILRIPEIDAFSVAWSPDGSRIATASHSGLDPVTGKLKYWTTIWPRLQRITGLDDPALWTATRYCPPIELRAELLGISEAVAADQLTRCRARVAEAERRGGRF